MLVDTVEKLELPLAHMIPELTANIMIPVLMLIYFMFLDWRLALIALATFSSAILSTASTRGSSAGGTKTASARRNRTSSSKLSDRGF